MKKGVVIFLHLGYWLLYCLLLLLIYVLIKESASDGKKNQAEGIGVHLTGKDSSLIIDNIIEGGAAQKQGELASGDVILKIGQGDSAAVDITKMAPEQVQTHKLVGGKKGTMVRLTVRKPDGQIKTISIVRDIYELENGPPPRTWFLLMLECAVLPGMLAFYLFYTVLFSYFLSKRKIVAFIVLALFMCACIAVLADIAVFNTFRDVHPTLEGIVGIGTIVAINGLLNGILGLVMRGFITWYGDIKIKEDLNKRNYEMELELVKSQINPHFLFNTLNNIDVLILKDPPGASRYLNKLSDIMRFMLYETKTEKVPLEKELDYIGKYLELQKIRSSNPEYVQYAVSGSPGGLMVEPMLFIPFIENAFKYAENKKAENAIGISIHIAEGKLIFECHNQYLAEGQNISRGGLGNELIRKRLMLLYPGKHQLDVTDTGSVYSVRLQINIT